MHCDIIVDSRKQGQKYQIISIDFKEIKEINSLQPHFLKVNINSTSLFKFFAKLFTSKFKKTQIFTESYCMPCPCGNNVAKNVDNVDDVVDDDNDDDPPAALLPPAPYYPCSW